MVKHCAVVGYRDKRGKSPEHRQLYQRMKKAKDSFECAAGYTH
jgi:hypothetical protein